jgi:UDP-N-acetylmuramoyl-tripeptide--D-alanyl-D-alanine ligase
VTGYSIDSRTIGAGELYFAVKGERLDGHEFVEAALANGAAAAVVSMRWLAPAELDPCRLLRVPDGDGEGVLAALQRLALAVRRMWGGRVIGVTEDCRAGLGGGEQCGGGASGALSRGDRGNRGGKV